MNRKIVFYALLAIFSVSSISSLLTLNKLLILASLIGFMVLITLEKLWFIIEPVIFRHSNLIEIFSGYELSGERTAAVRKIGNGFSATTAALLKNNKGTAIEREGIEGIIVRVHSPFKFIMQLERLDLKRIVDDLKTKRGMKEIELNKMRNESSKRNSAKINIIKRELEQLEEEIEKISSGGAPLKLAQYVMTSSVAESRFLAEEHAKSQIRELASHFGALLNADAQILSGGDLIKLLEIDSMML